MTQHLHPHPRILAQGADQARRDYEQRDAEKRRLVAEMTEKPRPEPRAMTPEQFAFWVKGIAETGFAQPLDLLNRILDTARVMK